VGTPEGGQLGRVEHAVSDWRVQDERNDWQDADRQIEPQGMAVSRSLSKYLKDDCRRQRYSPLLICRRPPVGDSASGHRVRYAMGLAILPR
jgi:hypothetical protein